MLKLNIRMVSLILIPVIFIFSACSGDNDKQNNKGVVTINDYKMTKKEFQAQCIDEMEYNKSYKTSAKGKQELLDCIIKKELLIQEAKRQGIDKNDKFVTAIEKYWEATLIKLLIEKKNTEIQKTTMVTDKEIKKRYNEHKLKNKDLPPLNTIEEEIASEILEQKKTKIFENWTEALHKNARIKIDKTFFTE